MRRDINNFSFKDSALFITVIGTYNLSYYTAILLCNVAVTLKKAAIIIAKEWHDSYTHEWRSMHRKAHRPGFVSETARADALLINLRAIWRANYWAHYMGQRLSATLVKYLKKNFDVNETYTKACDIFGTNFDAIFRDGTLNPAKNLAVSKFCHVMLLTFWAWYLGALFFGFFPMSVTTNPTLVNFIYAVVYITNNTALFLLDSLQFYAKVPTLATAMAGILSLLLVITVVSNLVIYFNFRFTHVMNKFFLKMKSMRYTKFK